MGELIFFFNSKKTSKWNRLFPPQVEGKQREGKERETVEIFWEAFRKALRDCRADGNLSWIDAAVIRFLLLILPGAIHLVVFNPDEMRMQFRSDAAGQRDYLAFLGRCILQLVANHRLVEETF